MISITVDTSVNGPHKRKQVDANNNQIIYNDNWTSMMSSKQSDVLSFFDNFKASAKTSHDEKLLQSIEVLPFHAGRLARGEHFSIFKEDHAEEAASVYNFLINLETYEDFKKHVERYRQIINEGIFIFAVSVACLHHKDTAGQLLPPPWQINPRSYFSSEAIFHAQRETRYRGDETDASIAPPLFTTGTVRDTEFKLAWWREDVMLNAHHDHWHQVTYYPVTLQFNEIITSFVGKVYLIAHICCH